jgi:hypothetical protein
LENATMNENSNPMEEIEKEIEEAKTKSGGDDFEIEIAEEPKEEETKQKENLDDEQHSARVRSRINKITEQRRAAEIETKKYQEETEQLKVNFSEQIADMRAAVRVQEMQKQMRAQQSISPTVGRAQQASTNPAPPKAMSWWEGNKWFNSKGYERETAAARAIDVQLDLEGYDKNSDEYYSMLNSRLQKVFPEVISSNDQSKRVKSRQTVAPTAGGSTYKGNRVRMTQDQLRMARELGINDEAGLKKYASEIQKSQRS